jgi:hypothetical protein
MWLNEMEVYDYLQRYAGDPVLGPAVRNLNRLVNVTNAKSDGWVYFKRPSNAAKKLCELLYEADFARRIGNRHGSNQTAERSANPTAADVNKASQPIKAFLTRQGWWADYGNWEVAA